MITLAILNAMNNAGVAGLVKSDDLHWEENPVKEDGSYAEGVWLVTRSGDASMSPKKLNLKSTVDIYVAFANKTKTEVVLKEIMDWIIANPAICSLSGSVDGTSYSYSFSNVRIRPTTTPENAGVTENDLIVKMASAQLTYDED